MHDQRSHVRTSSDDAKNPLFLREHADITGGRIVLPTEQDAVLQGSAMLGAVASGSVASVVEAMESTSANERVIAPSGGEVARHQEAKYKVFLRIYEDQMASRGLMEAA